MGFGTLVVIAALAEISTGISGTGIVAVVSTVCPVATGGGAFSSGPTGVGTVGTCPVVPGPGGTLCGLDVGTPIGVTVIGTSTGVGALVVMRFWFLAIFIVPGYKT